jgi:hypothetical protein
MKALISTNIPVKAEENCGLSPEGKIASASTACHSSLT